MATEAARISIKVDAEGAQKATQDINNLDKSIGSTGKTLEDFGRALGELAIIGTVIAGINKLTNAFAEAQTSTLRLDNALKMRNMENASAGVKKLSNQMQNLIGVDGDFVNQLQAELIMQGKSQAMTEKMIKAAANLSAVTGDDLATSLGQLNNSLSGMARELGRTNPEIKALTEEQLKAGGAIDIIAQKYGGMAEAMQGSLEVQKKVAEQARGDAMEALGEALAPAVLFVTQAMTELIKIATTVISFFNELPAPVKIVIGAITALVTALTVYNILQKNMIVQKALLIAGEVAMAAKTAIMTAVTWARNVAQVALNASTIVGLTLTGAGIALVGAAIAAGAAYAISQNQQAQANYDSADSLTKLNLSLEKQIGLFSTAQDWADVKTWDQITETLGVTREELKGVIGAFQNVKATAENVALGIKEGWIKEAEGVTRVKDAYAQAASSAMTYASSLSRTTKEGREAFENMTAQIKKLQKAADEWGAIEKALADKQKAIDDAKAKAIELAKEQAKAEADRKKSISDTIEKLKEEFITMKMSNEEKLIYNLSNKKATQSEIDKAVAIQRGIDITKDQIKASEELTKKNNEVTESQKNAKEKYSALLESIKEEAIRVNESDEVYKAYLKTKQDAEDVSLVKSMGLEGSEFDDAISKLREMRNQIKENKIATDTWGEAFNNVMGILDKLGSVFNSIAQISQNIHDAELQKIEGENEKNKESWDAKIAQAEKEGASIEQINELKAQAQKDQENRDKDYQKQRKKYAREQAESQKAAALFQATVSGAAAIVEAFKVNWVLGIATIGMVAAQQIAIMSTPLPEAQFGGEFMVPAGYAGDSGLLKVNSGEKVTVESARNSDNGPKSVIVQIGEAQFNAYMEEQVGKAINSGRVTINRAGVVRA